MLFFILLLINFSASFSQELDNCVDKEKYNYEYFYNGTLHLEGIDLKLELFSVYETEVIIKIPHLKIYEKLKLNIGEINKFIIRNFNQNGSNNGYGIIKTGIYIYSNFEIKVNLITECNHSNDKKCVHFSSTTLISNFDCGNNYKIHLTDQISSKLSLNIQSFSNENVINLNYGNPILNKEIILNKGENTFIIFNYNSNVVNLEINSKYPISIYQEYLTDGIIVQPNRVHVIYPNNMLGNEYILLPFEFNNNNLFIGSYYFQISFIDDNTSLWINDSFRGVFNKTTDFFEFSNIPLHIKSNKKISVMCYDQSIFKDNNLESNIPKGSFFHCLPTKQLSKSLDFIAISGIEGLNCTEIETKNDSLYCNILALKNDLVFLDGNILNGFQIIPNTNYAFKSQYVNKGGHKLSSKMGVQAIIYGHKSLLNNVYTHGFYSFNAGGTFNRDDADILINDKAYQEYLCGNSPFILSADAPREAVEFDWTINDTLNISGKEVSLDLPKPGKYNIKLKIDNDDEQVYEWTTTRLEEIKSDLDSVIYLCNDSLSNIDMNITGGGTSKSITWFPSENIKDPTQFNIEFIKPLKESTKLFYEVIDEHCCSYLDSVDIQITNVYPIITTTQNNFCYGDSTTLSLDKDYDSIIWNNGESTKDIIVKESGVYSATVTEGECINDTSIVINVNPLPTLDIEAPDGTILCDGGSIILEAKVPANTSIKWNDGTRLAKRTFNQSGTYTVTAEDIKTGCKNTKSIVVSDIENLKAEIQGDPTFCDGESTTLTIQPQGKSYLWSNGEISQSIVVNNSGVYSATITTDTDCKIDAEIEVEKLPLPTFQILGETIICNNTTTIYPDKDFEYYQWSNGEISKSITIDKAGDYELTVTDDNRCKATQNITITESTPEINLSNRDIDFGELLFGNTKSENISSDRDIIIIKNSSIFDVNYSNKNINISFNPKDIGEFKDTLIIESTGDCKATDTIYIKGICKAEILAKVSNSEGYPGDLVNNTVNLELMQNIPLPKDFNYEIDIQINQDAISIIDATTFNYTNNKLEINIADYLNKTSYDEEVKKINSKIMLAKNLENELLITRFETDNPYLIPIRQNGNIKIYEICLYEARLIEHYNEAIISNITQTNIKLSTYYAGKYTIEITDISGKTTTKELTTKSDKEEINFNYKLSNGTYIIKITEPGKTQTRKIVFVE